MSVSKRIYERVDEICRVCNGNQSECFECKMRIKFGNCYIWIKGGTELVGIEQEVNQLDKSYFVSRSSKYPTYLTLSYDTKTFELLCPVCRSHKVKWKNWGEVRNANNNGFEKRLKATCEKGHKFYTDEAIIGKELKNETFCKNT